MASNNTEWLVEGTVQAKVHIVVKAQTADAARRKAIAVALDPSGEEQTWWYNDDNDQALRDVRVLGVKRFDEPVVGKAV